MSDAIFTYFRLRVLFLRPHTQCAVRFYTSHHHLPQDIGQCHKVRLTPTGIGVITDHVVPITWGVTGQNWRGADEIMAGLCKIRFTMQLTSFDNLWINRYWYSYMYIYNWKSMFTFFKINYKNTWIFNAS